MHRGRQHNFCPQHSRERKRGDVAVMLVDEARAGCVAQQHPQLAIDAALRLPHVQVVALRQALCEDALTSQLRVVYQVGFPIEVFGQPWQRRS